MQLHPDGTFVVAATDLVGFLECDHLVTLEQLRAAGEIEKPSGTIQSWSSSSGAASSTSRPTSGVFRDGRSRPRDPAARTRRVSSAPPRRRRSRMRRGEDVIFQATFFAALARPRGLPPPSRRSPVGPRRVSTTSPTPSSHEAVKAAAILQMCVYADQLERLQGIPPETISVVTGDASHAHRLADYAAYFPPAKRRFEERVLGHPRRCIRPRTRSPWTTAACAQWWHHCAWTAVGPDHLSLVAGPRGASGGWSAPASPRSPASRAPRDRAVRDVEPRILERLRRCPSRASWRTGRHRYELIPPNPDRPAESRRCLRRRLDVFWTSRRTRGRARRRPRVPLFGWVERGRDGDPVYHATWAHDRAAEKGMLEAFVDTVLERRERDPGMHVYHYGGYESGALKRHAAPRDARTRSTSSSASGPRQPLQHVVRQGVRASVESFSIKKLEAFLHAPSARERDHRGEASRSWVRALDDRAGPGDPRRHRGLQPRRLHLQPPAPRLAGGAPRSRPRPVVPRRGRPATRHRRRRPAGGARPQPRRRREPARTRSGPGVPVDRLERSETEQARWLLAGAARLASARGEAAVVGPLPADGRIDRGPRRGRLGAGRAHVRGGRGAHREVRASTATASTLRRRAASSRARPSSRSLPGPEGWQTSGVTVSRWTRWPAPSTKRNPATATRWR